jgi:hypothetical protein
MMPFNLTAWHILRCTFATDHAVTIFGSLIFHDRRFNPTNDRVANAGLCVRVSCISHMRFQKSISHAFLPLSRVNQRV